MPLNVETETKYDLMRRGEVSMAEIWIHWQKNMCLLIYVLGKLYIFLCMCYSISFHLISLKFRQLLTGVIFIDYKHAANFRLHKMSSCLSYGKEEKKR